VITALHLLNPDATTRTLDCILFNLGRTRLLLFPLAPRISLLRLHRYALRVRLARLVFVERDHRSVCSAHSKPAVYTSEDGAFGARIVDLTGWATFSETVEKLFVRAEETAHGEFVEEGEYVGGSIFAHVLVGEYRLAVAGWTDHNFRPRHLDSEPLEETGFANVGVMCAWCKNWKFARW